MATQHSTETPKLNLFVYDKEFSKLVQESVWLNDYLSSSKKSSEVSNKIFYEDSLYCLVCCIKFKFRAEQLEHLKSPWHCYNLRQKLQMKKTLTFDEFNGLKDDESSESSDSEREDHGEEACINPREKFTKTCFKTVDDRVVSISSCLLHNKKIIPKTGKEYVSIFQNLPNSLKWCVILIGGGYFAATIFNRDQVDCHKTFHKYTCRQKQGGSQRGADNKSGGPKIKSSGSQIRRQNEAHLISDIQELLNSWAPKLKECDLIFYQAANFNQVALFKSSNPPLIKTDPKLRTIPLTTRQPSFNETKRVHKLLSKVKFYDLNDFIKDEENAQNNPIESIKVSEFPYNPSCDLSSSESKKDDSESSSDESDKEEDIIVVEKKASLETTEAKKPKKKNFKDEGPSKVIKDIEAIERRKNLKELSSLDNLDELSQYLQSLKLPKGPNKAPTTSLLSQYLNESLDKDGNTVLHLASRSGHTQNVHFLMEQGSNPCTKNNKGLFPYSVSKDRTVRDCFREFSGLHPDKYDYESSQIPPPLTDEQKKLRTDKNLEKKKDKKKKLKEKKQEEALKNDEDYQMNKFLGLAVNEKVTYNSNSPKNPLRCFTCAKKIPASPFSYNDFQFCTVACLRVHRFQSS